MKYPGPDLIDEQLTLQRDLAVETYELLDAAATLESALDGCHEFTQTRYRQKKQKAEADLLAQASLSGFGQHATVEELLAAMGQPDPGEQSARADIFWTAESLDYHHLQEYTALLTGQTEQMLRSGLVLAAHAIYERNLRNLAACCRAEIRPYGPQKRPPKKPPAPKISQVRDALIKVGLTARQDTWDQLGTWSTVRNAIAHSSGILHEETTDELEQTLRKVTSLPGISTQKNSDTTALLVLHRPFLAPYVDLIHLLFDQLTENQSRRDHLKLV